MQQRGHLDFAGIAEGIEHGAQPRLVLVGMLLTIVGLAFKVSLVPFHMWTPDAYQGAITPVTTFMSVVVKAAAFAVMIRVMLLVFGDELSTDLETGWPPALAALAAFTMIYGNIAAVVQKNVKRMLAYSSIAHAGYLLVGLLAALHFAVLGVSSVLFYLLVYTVSNALAFGSLIILGSRGKEAVSYDDLRGVGRRHPLASLPFIVGVLSLMGFSSHRGIFCEVLYL